MLKPSLFYGVGASLMLILSSISPFDPNSVPINGPALYQVGWSKGGEGLGFLGLLLYLYFRHNTIKLVQVEWRIFWFVMIDLTWQTSLQILMPEAPHRSDVLLCARDDLGSYCFIPPHLNNEVCIISNVTNVRD